MRLYTSLRQRYTTNWVSILQLTVRNMNATPSPALNNLAPEQLAGPLRSPLRDIVQGLPRVHTREEAEKNERDYLASPNALRVGDYVLKDVVKPSFSKDVHSNR